MIRRGLLFIAVGLLLAGCGPVVPQHELPEAPLAFLHRTLAQGRDRADALQKRRGDAAKNPQSRGVADLDAFGSMLDRLRGGRSEVRPGLQGRLALYYPQTKRIEEIDAFGPGALPFAWSRDRSRLLVASRHRGMPQLFEYSAIRADIAPAVVGHGMQIGGAFGPDDRIAFLSGARVEERLQISVWLNDAAGARPRQATPGPRDGGLRWSPDGRILLYHSPLRNGQWVIKALDPDDDAAAPRVIARGREPTFSPDGAWVVYSRERGAGWRLWRMRPDGTGKTALGHRNQGQADERLPTVSPDGRWVAYNAQSEDRDRIRIRGMDGSGDRLLIEDADGASPVW